jgi:hypothetical protein
MFLKALQIWQLLIPSVVVARWAFGAMVGLVAGIPPIPVTDIAAAMLDQVIKGFEKEPLMPEDLIRIAATLPKAA